MNQNPHDELTALRQRVAHLETQVAERDALLHEIMNRISDAVCITDPNGTVRAWNPGCERLTGVAAAEAVGQTLAQIAPDLVEQADPEGMGSLVTVGSQHWLEGVFIFGPAVVYRAKAEPGYPSLFVSDNIERLSGYSSAEFEHKPHFWSRLIPAEDLAAYDLPTPLRTLREHEQLVKEYRMQHRDGSYRWVRDEFRLLYHPDGTPHQIIGSLIDITRHKQTEAALLESEQKFRGVIEQAYDGIRLLDPQGTIIEWNKGSERITGLKREQVLGRPIWDVVFDLLGEHPQRDTMRAYIRSSIEHFLERNIAVLNEPTTRIKRPDGTHRYVHTTIFPIRTTAGTLIGEVTHDITQQIETEQALRDSEALYRSLVEQIPAVTYTASLTTLYQTRYISPQVEKLLGISQEDWIANPELWIEYLHPDDRERVLAIKAKQLPQTPVVSEHRVIAADGSIHWVHDISVLVKTKTDAPPTIQGVVFDVTAEKQAEAELRSAEHRLEKMLETMVDGMVMIDQAGQIVFANRAAERILSLSRSDIVTRTYDTPVWQQVDEHGEMLPADKLPVAMALNQQREVEAYEHGIRQPGDSEIRWLSVNAAPLLDEAGQITGAVASFRDVTDERYNEAAYRALVDFSLQGLVIFQKTQIVFINQTAAQITGYPSDELLGMSLRQVRDLIHPDDRDAIWALFWNNGRGPDTPQRAGFRVIRRDGTIYWLEMYGSRIHFHGNPAVQAAIIDITERKETEAAYRVLVEHSLQGLVIAQDMRIVFANSVMQQITGYSLDELYAMDASQGWLMAHPEDRALIQRHLDGTHPLPTHFEIRALRKDATVYWLEAFVSPVEHQGRPALYISVLDVTERKQAEGALRDSQQMLETIINHVPESVFWKDRDLVYIGCNRHFARIAEVDSPADIAGKTDFDMPWRERALALRAEDQHVLNTGDPLLHIEREEEIADGTRRWIRLAKLPVRDAEGNIVGLLGTLEDVTRHKEAEQQRLALAVEREKVHILANFIDAASHEFKTPLSIINANLYILQRAACNEEYPEQIVTLQQQSRYIQELVEGMLTMSRLDSATELPQQRVDLNELVNNVLISVTPRKMDLDLTITTQLAEDLPRIEANARELQRAIYHVVQNALTYTPSSGTITIQTTQQDDLALLEIQDTGIGIEEEHLQHIFERFYRIEKARTERGAGLGLSIARKIVELHHGRLTVTSSPGEGSTFTLHLPLPAAE